VAGQRPSERHRVFQISLMSALLDGVYDGDLTIEELLRQGDFGLGTFNALDGELLVLDGTCYQLNADGGAHLASGDQRTPFAVVTTFVPHIVAEISAPASQDQVGALVSSLVPSQNYLYAVRMTGDFQLIRMRTVARQQRPYRPLVDVTRGEPVVELTDVGGAFVGFRTPLYERGIGVPGGHLHFIDDERRRGGHVLDFVVRRATLELCFGTDLHLALPLGAEFAAAHLDPADLPAQLEATEHHH